MKLIEKIRADIEKVNQIENRFHRDLVALIYSPTITHASINNNLDFNFSENAIDELVYWLNDVDSLKVPDFNNYLPLGKYAEELVLFYLQNQTSFDLITNNIQLIEGKLTIGELDYLFQDEQGKNIHLEFAIKFYLDVAFNGEQTLLGPSTKDNMQRKVKKLKSHQLQLCQRYVHLLPEEAKNIVFTPKVCLKGSLFYPFNNWINEEYNMLSQGWWIHVNEMNTLNTGAFYYHLITDKKDWIFPFNKELQKHSFSELLKKAEKLLATRNEIMVVRFNEKMELLDRGFIVRLNWPH